MDNQHLIEAIQDELGFDVYHLYPDSRRLIPPEVLWAIAGACAVEVLKGLIPFESLGKELRGTLEELMHRWRRRDDLDGYVLRLNLSTALDEALSKGREHLASTTPATADVERATERLRQALMEFGQQDGPARRHSERIAQIVVETLGPRD